MLAIIVQNVEKKLWQPLELEIINHRNLSSSEPKKVHKLSKDIVLLLFDDKTQFLLRQNGVPIKDFEAKGRNLIRQAIEKLENSGAKAIGINLNLNSPVPADKALAKTLTKYKNIVIAGSVHSYSYTLNNTLARSASFGYGELYADYDKVVHKIKLFDEEHGNKPSFTYSLYKAATNQDLEIGFLGRKELYLRYPKAKFTKYSLIDLLEDKLNENHFKDKIVIFGIGRRGKLLRDQLLSPIYKEKLVSDSEVQAVALANLFNKSYMYKLGLDDFKFSFIFFSMFLGALFSSLAVVRRLVVALLLFIAVTLSAQIAYTHFNLILEMVPLVFVLFGNLVTGSLVYLQLNLQKQNIALSDSKHMLQGKNIELAKTLSELNERVNELKEVRKQLATRSEEERKRIARDLHDDTLARITDLRRKVELITSSKDLSPGFKQELENSVQTLNNVTQEVRRIINALRPSMLDNVLGLIPAIENLLDELSKRSLGNIETKLVTKLSTLKLSEPDEIHLYRIIQEALNNVSKHSNATKAEIIIEQQPGQVLILVSDNGVGFDLKQTSPKQSFGLEDMKERAELISVQIQYLNKLQGSGTTLEIVVPEEKIVSIELEQPSTVAQ